MDGEWLVFDAGAGDTHLLDPFTAFVLDRIEAAAIDERQLQAAISRELALEGLPAHSSDALDSVLRSLAKVGLVEPVPLLP